LGDEVDFEPPAEAATKQVIMHDDPLGRQASDRSYRLRTRHHLSPDPDFTAVLADVSRAIYGLHGCVRQKGKLVDGIELGLGACHCFVQVTGAARNRARLLRRYFHLTDDVSRAERRVRAFVPLNFECSEALLGRAHMLGDHGYDLIHAVPGTLASMPNAAVPFTLAGASSRLAGFPINVNSLGSLSGILSGTGNRAAFSARSP
jgi:hypothetical protein